VTARLLPFTVDGLIWAASMVVLDTSRRGQPVPRLSTTAGGLELGCWDRGHGRRQLGAWCGTWPGRCAGQCVARAGAGCLVRAAYDADPHRAWHAGGWARAWISVPACATAGAGRAAETVGCANTGADHPRAVRGRRQSTCHRPRLNIDRRKAKRIIGQAALLALRFRHPPASAFKGSPAHVSPVPGQPPGACAAKDHSRGHTTMAARRYQQRSFVPPQLPI
jgi:hypothetical protein